MGREPRCGRIACGAIPLTSREAGRVKTPVLLPVQRETRCLSEFEFIMQCWLLLRKDLVWASSAQTWILSSNPLLLERARAWCTALIPPPSLRRFWRGLLGRTLVALTD